MINRAWKDLENKLKDYPNRIKHTKGVTNSVIKLSNYYQVYSPDLVVASIYHDYFKYDHINDLKQYINIFKRIKYSDHPYLYHAYASYKYVKRLYPNLNKNALLAIKNHVLSRPKMSIEEKILFISDYLDGIRDFINYDELMKIATKSLDQAIVYCLDKTFAHLKKNNIKLHIRQIMSYNYYKGRLLSEIKENDWIIRRR